jgi:hypothetical protein
LIHAANCWGVSSLSKSREQSCQKLSIVRWSRRPPVACAPAPVVVGFKIVRRLESEPATGVTEAELYLRRTELSTSRRDILLPMWSCETGFQTAHSG